MKPTLLIWGMVLGSIVTLPIAGVGREEQPEDRRLKDDASPSLTIAQSQQREPDRRSASSSSQPQPQAEAMVLPVYNPPHRGTPSPGRRIGGGTRGDEAASLRVAVIAPDDMGRTLREQPVLYWFTSSEITKKPVQVTLIEEHGIIPVFETWVKPPIYAGFQEIRLADYGIRLASGRPYKWSVALVMNMESRSKDVVAEGSIERPDKSGAITIKSGAPASISTVHQYAREKLWYDAIMEVSTLIDADPANVNLHKQRASLLEQVGLGEIAAYETKLPAKGGK